ncbi:TRAP transporter small permease [Glaciecola petra]|uniref:TRAP transporter small permease protein n=1 Tax=Glaciecola petra TaxID=3075602 RepID=A0ABU2ZUF8_9ALTE|nr:TRAP transporter small permease [Aestuariibacter sp. P117]MDT0596278.1 TRAP transporter small permease [Aestuariibacter sp. P117]
MNSTMALRRFLDKVLEPILIIIVLLLVVTVLWQVTSRYILASPSTFTSEVARILLIWLTLIGAAWVVGQRAHLSVDLLIEKLSAMKAILLQGFIHITIAVFAVAVLVVGGANLVYTTLHLGQMTTVLQIPMGYVYVALPLSGLLMLVYSICDVLLLHSSSSTDAEVN